MNQFVQLIGRGCSIQNQDQYSMRDNSSIQLRPERVYNSDEYFHMILDDIAHKGNGRKISDIYSHLHKSYILGEIQILGNKKPPYFQRQVKEFPEPTEEHILAEMVRHDVDVNIPPIKSKKVHITVKSKIIAEPLPIDE